MAAKKKKNSPKKRKSNILLYVLLFILLAVSLRSAAVLVILGMLPSMVASYVDNTSDRNHVRVVAACNFSGVLPYVMQLLASGSINPAQVHDLLLTPHVWLTMFGAAAFGWGLVLFFPQVVLFVLRMAQKRKVDGLLSRQQQIVDEWGLEVENATRRALRNAAFQEERKRHVEQAKTNRQLQR